jgi:hypothetical protein
LDPLISAVKGVGSRLHRSDRDLVAPGTFDQDALGDEFVVTKVFRFHLALDAHYSAAAGVERGNFSERVALLDMQVNLHPQVDGEDHVVGLFDAAHVYP